MQVVHERCCGLDVHKKTVVACVLITAERGRVERQVRTFSTMTEDLLRHGLLRASFIPPAPIRELRELTRYRKTLIRERSQEVNRLHKVLEGANIKLGSVVTDVLGVSARRMLDAMLGGQRDPEGSVKYAGTKGATASFTFTGGRQVAWVAPKGANRGYAYIYLDGTKVATINLYASSAQYRKVVFLKAGLNPSVPHTLKVYVTGTKQTASTGSRVDIDGFVVIR